MSGKIDWMYHRKNCISCQRARDYIQENELSVASDADARIDRRGRDEALKLAKTADKIIVGRGKKVTTIDMKKDPPDDDTLVSLLLGPTGNLRAPTIRKGKTLLVGFSAEAYKEVLGG